MQQTAKVVSGPRQECAVQWPANEHEVGDPQIVGPGREDGEGVPWDESDPSPRGAEQPVRLLQGEARPVPGVAGLERVDACVGNLTGREMLAGHLDQTCGTLSGAHAEFDDPLDAPPVDRLIDRAVRGRIGEMEKIEQPQAISNGQRRPP